VKLQSAIHLLFPPRCLCCGEETTADFALCSGCWRETPFLSGLVCNACGLPLPGDGEVESTYCDSCLIAPRPWRKGRAALAYAGNARRLVLALKHGDRTDLIPAFADWMVEAGRPLGLERALIAPVPLHWRRLFTRRFNQAALLGEAVAKKSGAVFCPDLLVRLRATRPHAGMTGPERAANQRGAFAVPGRHLPRVDGRPIVLVDDVMTSGATLAACSEALLGAGATEVQVLVLARVARDT
jgi:ComF family protein